jgi:hypothetical protein
METITVPCAHLRHKGMYVLSVADDDPSLQYGSYDATAYWCTCTQKPYGPDGKPAHAKTCTASRECCK